MKNIKKLLAAILSSAMLLSVVSTSALAADASPREIEKEVSSNGYSFTITERTYPNYSVSRTYRKDATKRSAPSKSETKAMLHAMGMDQNEIDSLSDNTLNKFANSNKITVTTSYSKHSDSSNQTIGLPKETALAEAAILRQKQETSAIQQAKAKNSTIDPDPAEFEDTYMKVTYTVSEIVPDTEKDKGLFHFYTEATWLTMPFFRELDSIGSCAMNGTIVNKSRSGSYSYTTKTYYSTGTSTAVKSEDIPITDLRNVIDGNWYGSAGVFPLPEDPGKTPSSAVIKHTDLSARYEYDGYVTFPDQASNFNTVGSYAHASHKLLFSPSVTISYPSGVDASIGLSITPSADYRNAETLVKYYPN